MRRTEKRRKRQGGKRFVFGVHEKIFNGWVSFLNTSSGVAWLSLSPKPRTNSCLRP